MGVAALIKQLPESLIDSYALKRLFGEGPLSSGGID
jgi:hypothetical protein